MRGQAAIPGAPYGQGLAGAGSAGAGPAASTDAGPAAGTGTGAGPAAGTGVGGGTEASTSRYVPEIPQPVTRAFLTAARAPLTRAEPLYQDVASRTGIPWELLAACDWMQCKAHPRISPVHGEKLGTPNSDGTVYRTKSEALAQCANDLVELANAVTESI